MEQGIDIERCDFECSVNNTNHRTELNGVDRLIVRRAQPFTITLHLKPGSQPVQAGASNLTLTAETGPLPREESGTKVSFSLTDSTVNTAWSVSAASPSGNTVSLSISSAPNAPIGLYRLTLDQVKKVHLGEFILLFNPWSTSDAVYMKSEGKRQEYVLAQDGLIYIGTSTRIKARPWVYGQFEKGILDICLKILDSNRKFLADADADCSGRRNPIYVTRVISAMVNSSGDGHEGVLEGRWTGDYSAGMRPTRWTASSAILRQWAENQYIGVRYAQCWVFAAVACTVSRCLGIPCRVVTNFGSAHDTNCNLLIECLYDEEGENIHSDSIWNFHVWVDSWMTRPDLTSEYNGWQASDPTPQEKSDGVHCCGPVPLKAIKDGELTMKYDAPFVYAEVNADVVEYVILSDGSMAKMGGSTTDVGHFISTKAVGTDERRDITDAYKHPEGSEEERQAFQRAKHRNKLQKLGEQPGLHVKIKLSPNMAMGSDMEVSAVVTNNTMVDKKCRFLFYGNAVTYDGQLGGRCAHLYESRMLFPAGEVKTIPLKLEYSQYGEVITSDKLIKLVLMVIQLETFEFQKDQKTVVLENPDINIQVLGEARVDHTLSAEISLQNPLPESLHDCCFTVEGAGLTGGETLIHKVETVGPKQEAKVKVEFTPTTVGTRKLLVDFDSDKLSNVKGFLNIDINA